MVPRWISSIHWHCVQFILFDSLPCIVCLQSSNIEHIHLYLIRFRKSSQINMIHTCIAKVRSAYLRLWQQYQVNGTCILLSNTSGHLLRLQISIGISISRRGLGAYISVTKVSLPWWEIYIYIYIYILCTSQEWNCKSLYILAATKQL